MLGAGRLVAVDLMDERLEHARAFGAELRLNGAATTLDERVDAVRDLTGGLGADVVVDCSGTSGTFLESLELVRAGGTVIEAGAFVDMGPVEINPNRHICTKGVSVLGIGGETLEQYGPSLAMLARHQQRLPFARAITHEVGLEQVEDALALAQTGAAMKVLVAPNGAA
jgi:L-iditol 2-dehydrogenase